MLKLRGLYTRWLNRNYRKRLGSLGERTIIHRRATIEGFLHGVKLGSNVWLRRDSLIECDQPTAKVEIGDNTLIGPAAMLFTCQGSITIGDNCSINAFCVLHGQGGLTIGNWVRIAPHVSIITSSHLFDDPDVPIKRQGMSMRGVVIEDDVWIGTGVRIIDGCRIGHGSVVGAGAVVTKDIPPFSIAVGVPARVVGRRGDRKTEKLEPEKEVEYSA